MTVLNLRSTSERSIFDADAAALHVVDRDVSVAEVIAAADSVEGRLFAKHDRLAGQWENEQPLARFHCRVCGLVSELWHGTLEQLDEFDADSLHHIQTCRVHA